MTIHRDQNVYTHTTDSLWVVALWEKYSMCFLNIMFSIMTKCCFCCCCSVAKSCLTLCDPMDRSTPGFPVLHYFLEFAQTHIH